MPRLLGIDIGYSTTRASTGWTWWDGHNIHIQNTISDPSLWPQFQAFGPFDVVAIDGPLLPDEHDIHIRRSAETLLARGVFAKRCRAAYSHTPIATPFIQATGKIQRWLKQHKLYQQTPVETFPHAVLAVGLPDEYFTTPIPRARKSDWLYEQALQSGYLKQLIDSYAPAPAIWLPAFTAARNHDTRAAFICLLMAAIHHLGASFTIGTAADGFIHLPPQNFWQSWALDACKAEQTRIM